MKALVLAGGFGTRLRPFTHTSAKQLVPVVNRPILFHVLEAVAAAQVTDVGIVVGDTEPEIRAAVGDGARFGLRVTYIPQGRPLGLAHAVTVARRWLHDDDFVMYLGDNILHDGITEQTRRFRSTRPDAQLMLAKVGDPTQFGVAVLDATGAVRSVEEKPAVPSSDLALVGVYFFSHLIHRAIAHIRPSSRGELEITDALQWLIDTGADVRSSVISGYWKDTGNVADYLEANHAALERVTSRCEGAVDPESELVGTVVVEAGASIRGSRVVGPTVIGRGSVITGSAIGPYAVVGENCVLADTVLRRSVVCAGAVIRGVRAIESSVIGRNADVTGAPTNASGHRLVLGDHSAVRIGS
ncbi:glucose-1-phosphate thymidylyltransferase [Streptomyces xanthochromogenes]|uniref:glucose-1-phosphate thymidylyltransferase n=1 Tax=Streptomyces xanthochromogenes TaxID=67384 RepID=UPI0034264711